MRIAKPLTMMAALVVIVMTLGGADGCFTSDSSPTSPGTGGDPKILTGPQFCAQAGSYAGMGMFYCGTMQTNISERFSGLPNGWKNGFCAAGGTTGSYGTNGKDKHGYVATTYNGGVGFVTDYSSAWADCNLLGGLSGGCSGVSICDRP